MQSWAVETSTIASWCPLWARWIWTVSSCAYRLRRVCSAPTRWHSLCAHIVLEWLLKKSNLPSPKRLSHPKSTTQHQYRGQDDLKHRRRNFVLVATRRMFHRKVAQAWCWECLEREQMPLWHRPKNEKFWKKSELLDTHSNRQHFGKNPPCHSDRGNQAHRRKWFPCNESPVVDRLESWAPGKCRFGLSFFCFGARSIVQRIQLPCSHSSRVTIIREMSFSNKKKLSFKQIELVSKDFTQPTFATSDGTFSVSV